MLRKPKCKSPTETEHEHILPYLPESETLPDHRLFPLREMECVDEIVFGLAFGEVRKDALPFRIDHQPQDGIGGLCYNHELMAMWTIRSVTRFTYPMHTNEA